ncbi:MAG: hypothetical protein SOS24_01420, partial [Clostridia bacterium]|nr:hypothetical protein [Clostridia bacterium]
MKKIPFVLMILFTVLLNTYAVSAQTAVLRENDAVPTLKTAVQKYGNYSTGTVKLTAMPDSCHIIIAQYNNNICINAEVRKYRTETEVFNIPDEVDMVKVFIWRDLSGIKPVTDAEIIDMKSSSELDKKVEAIANNLRTGKNQNVITYKTEENEPRAVIWTK